MCAAHYNNVNLSSRARLHLHTLYTCTPNSLVGTTIIANAHVNGATPSHPAFPASASALCITGTAYASVLPLPVSAQPKTSKRSRTARGMTAVWMGRGEAKPWGKQRQLGYG